MPDSKGSIESVKTLGPLNSPTRTACEEAHDCADLASDGSVLVVGLPDSGVGGRSVRVFTADPSGAYVERLNITAPTNGPGGSRFGAQVTCNTALEFARSCILP